MPFSNRQEAEVAMNELSTDRAEELYQAMMAVITDPSQLPRLEPNFFGGTRVGQA